MISIRALAAASAVLAMSGVGVSAADLYGGRGSIKDDYVPVAQPVDACGGWYARIDGGYSGYDTPSITQTNVDDLIRPGIKDTWSLGGGIGRYFTCHLRGDVTYDHRFSSDVTGTNGNVFSPANGDQRFKLSSDVVLFNAYYDFDTRSRFTPYVGVGLGFTRNAIGAGTGTVAATGPVPGDTITINGNANTHAAAALMAGFSLAMTDRLALDAGYRFLYLGSAQSGHAYDLATGGDAGPNKVEDLHAHEFRLGLRYAFGGGSNCCATYAPMK